MVRLWLFRLQRLECDNSVIYRQEIKEVRKPGHDGACKWHQWHQRFKTTSEWNGSMTIAGNNELKSVPLATWHSFCLYRALSVQAFASPRPGVSDLSWKTHDYPGTRMMLQDVAAVLHSNIGYGVWLRASDFARDEEMQDVQAIVKSFANLSQFLWMSERLDCVKSPHFISLLPISKVIKGNFPLWTAVSACSTLNASDRQWLPAPVAMPVDTGGLSQLDVTFGIFLSVHVFGWEK